MNGNGNGIQRSDFAAIAEWVRPGSRVLDLGCGQGLSGTVAAALGALCAGIPVAAAKACWSKSSPVPMRAWSAVTSKKAVSAT